MYRTKQKADYYTTFLDSIRSPFTKKVYKNSLNLYLKDIDVKDPDKLINEQINLRELEDNLIQYITYLQKEKQLSYSTVHTRLAAVFHFYTINRINIAHNSRS